MSSAIEWTDETWEVVTGCTEVSPGCANCYAARMAATRLKHHPRFGGHAVIRESRPRWSGRITAQSDLLCRPTHWRKPRRIFVCSRSDLFHPFMPDHFLEGVFGTIRVCPHHTFQILTKRVYRAAQFVAGCDSSALSNVWIGTSIEDQQRAEGRLPHLADIPAAVRFVSAEPLLGSIEIPDEHWSAIDWLIIGCESGPNRRPCQLEWVESLIDQAKANNVPVFVKQLSVSGKVSRNAADWPERFRIREWPLGQD